MGISCPKNANVPNPRNIDKMYNRPCPHLLDLRSWSSANWPPHPAINATMPYCIANVRPTMESVNCGDSDCRRGAVNFPTVKVFHINYIYNIVIDIDGEQKLVSISESLKSMCKECWRHLYLRADKKVKRKLTIALYNNRGRKAVVTIAPLLLVLSCLSNSGRSSSMMAPSYIRPWMK